jgi:hypothetical protein
MSNKCSWESVVIGFGKGGGKVSGEKPVAAGEEGIIGGGDDSDVEVPGEVAGSLLWGVWEGGCMDVLGGAGLFAEMALLSGGLYMVGGFA